MLGDGLKGAYEHSTVGDGRTAVADSRDFLFCVSGGTRGYGTFMARNMVCSSRRLGVRTDKVSWAEGCEVVEG